MSVTLYPVRIKRIRISRLSREVALVLEPTRSADFLRRSDLL